MDDTAINSPQSPPGEFILIHSIWEEGGKKGEKREGEKKEVEKKGEKKVIQIKNAKTVPLSLYPFRFPGSRPDSFYRSYRVTFHCSHLILLPKSLQRWRISFQPIIITEATRWRMLNRTFPYSYYRPLPWAHCVSENQLGIGSLLLKKSLSFLEVDNDPNPKPPP